MILESWSVNRFRTKFSILSRPPPPGSFLRAGATKQTANALIDHSWGCLLRAAGERRPVAKGFVVCVVKHIQN